MLNDARVHEQKNKTLTGDQQIQLIDELEKDRDNYKRRLEIVKKKNENLKLKLAKARGLGPDEMGYRQFTIQDSKGHDLKYMQGLPKTYTSVRCDNCKRQELERKEFFYHCHPCAYDLCLRCVVSIYNPMKHT